MWEYDRFTFKNNTIRELVDELNKLGVDNWEIIYYTEEKPPKFGEKWVCTVLGKRLKTSMSNNPVKM